MSKRPLLITVDVGGTLGRAEGPGLGMRLTAASPLPADHTREIMRTRLHTQPQITDAVVTEICEALSIPPDAFPRDVRPAPLALFPGTLEALRSLAEIAPVVTLSNVTCADADTDGLRRLLSPWVTGFFPSCDIGYAKPDPRAFYAVAEHHRLAPSSVIHIGDDWRCDVLGSLAAGMIPVWISGGRSVPSTPSTGPGHDVLVADDLATAAAVIHALHP